MRSPKLRPVLNLSQYSVEGGRNFAGDDWNITLKDLDEYYFTPLRACVQKSDIAAFMCTISAQSVLLNWLRRLRLPIQIALAACGRH